MTSQDLPAGEVADAVGRGIDRILSLQQDGMWRGFPTSNGASETWATAFVASHLKAIRPDLEAIYLAQEYLANRRGLDDGWS